MRVVFDTNVIVAGLTVRGLCHELIELHLPLHESILSRDLWEELLSTLRDKLGLRPAGLPFLDLYRRHSSWVDPAPLTRRLGLARERRGQDAVVVGVAADAAGQRGGIDPDDDRVLAAALAGKAEAIITGDSDLLVLGEFEDVRIMTPRGFLEIA